MTNERKIHTSSSSSLSFLFIGILIGAGGLYLLGTKNGREIVRKMVDAFESMEYSADDIVSELEQLAQHYVEKQEEGAEARVEQAHDTLDGVMDKIKNVLPIRKDVRRFTV